jgi:electron transfer flavoprotein alpha subunit
MIEVNKKGEVWIFAEQHGGKLEETSLELLSKGRELADTLKVPLATVLLGDRVSELCVRLGQYGADKVILAEHPLLEHYQTSSYAKVIHELIHKHQPQIVLYGATPCGRDLAPRVASSVKAGLTADCTDLQICNH